MSDLPLYQTIYNDYVEAIESGRLEVGFKIPAEKTVASDYNVSRITSKRAMEMLRDDGYIERAPGRGSFVAERHPKHSVSATTIGHKNGKSKAKPLIGLVIPDFSESYGMEIVTGVEGKTRELGYNLMLKRSAFNIADENTALDDLQTAGCEGLILMPQHNDFFSDRILRMILDQYPIVIIDRDMRGIDTTFISSDNYQDALQATSVMIEYGHEEIGFLSYPIRSATTLEERMSGFRNAFYSHKLYWDEKYMLNTFADNSGESDIHKRAQLDRDLIKKFIMEHPEMTALFATEYNFAQLALLAIEELGLQAPYDLSVVGYDGPSSSSGNAHLTRILQPQEEIGFLAVQTLIQKIHGEEHPKNVKLPSTLRMGTSLGKARTHKLSFKP